MNAIEFRFYQQSLTKQNRVKRMTHEQLYNLALMYALRIRSGESPCLAIKSLCATESMRRAIYRFDFVASALQFRKEYLINKSKALDNV